MRAKLIFITGTNTGTGKTLITCLGLHHLRNKGHSACGLKPFCSGSRSDAHHVRFHGGQAWNLEEVNPWFFIPPISPGAMPKQSQIAMEDVIKYVEKKRRDCGYLVIEGAGGIMSPLGPGYHLGTLIKHFNTDTILVAPNKLGVLNQILLTHDYLRRERLDQNLKVVLMGQKKTDLSSESNASVLFQWIPSCKVIELPYMGPNAKSRASIRENATKFQPKLNALFPF